MEKDFQTRSHDGELRFFRTFKEAYDYAKSNSEVWKISFPLGNGERLRLVRESLRGSMFIVSQMDDEIEEIRRSQSR